MKVELVKETEHGKDRCWYEVRKNGFFLKGSFDLEEMQKVYETVLDGTYQKKTVEVLQSHEINLPSEDTKTLF